MIAMSYNTHKTAVTTLVTEEAKTTEGVKMMLDNCLGIAKGVDHCFDYSAEKVIELIREVVDDIEYDYHSGDFEGAYAVERHTDEVIFFGNVRLDLGNAYGVVLHWEALEHLGKRTLEAKVTRLGDVISQKAKRFDPYESDAAEAVEAWIDTLADAVGASDDD